MDLIAISRLAAGATAHGTQLGIARAAAAWKLGGELCAVQAPLQDTASAILQQATEARVTGRLLAHIKAEAERLAPLAVKSREDLRVARERLALLKAELNGQTVEPPAAPQAKASTNGVTYEHAN